MTDVVIDTNVAVVANDRSKSYPAGCPLACIERLRVARSRERIVLDLDWEILEDYGRNLKSKGQPGPGDAFYHHVLRQFGNDKFTRLVRLRCDSKGGYEAFPTDGRLSKFDQSDRKFVAAAIVAGAQVLNAVDSDWRDYEAILKQHGVAVQFVCGVEAAIRGSQS